MLSWAGVAVIGMNIYTSRAAGPSSGRGRAAAAREGAVERSPLRVFGAFVVNSPQSRPATARCWGGRPGVPVEWPRGTFRWGTVPVFWDV